MAHRTSARRPAAAARLLVLAGLLALPVAPAAAQVVSIPASTVTSPTIGGEQQQQLQSYVQAHVDGLFSADPGAMRRSRAALVSPLENQQASVAFRQAYGRALGEPVERLLAGEEPEQRILGLALLGELATDDAVQSLTQAVASEEDPIRLFAITRGERVFEILAITNTGATPERVVALAQRIGEGIPEEEATLLADTRARALAKAAQVPPGRVQGLRDAALRAIGSRYGARVRQLQPDALEENALRALIRTAENTRQNLVQAGGSMPGREATRDLLAFSGDILSLMDAAVRAGALPEGTLRQLAATATGEAELLYTLTRTELGNSAVAPVGFRQMLESGNQRDFSLRYQQLFGSQGELTRQPFGLDAARFSR